MHLESSTPPQSPNREHWRLFVPEYPSSQGMTASASGAVASQGSSSSQSSQKVNHSRSTDEATLRRDLRKQILRDAAHRARIGAGHCNQ